MTDPVGSDMVTSAIDCSSVWKVSGKGSTDLPAIDISASGWSHTGTSCNTVTTVECFINNAMNNESTI